MQEFIYISALYTYKNDPNTILNCVVGCTSFSSGLRTLEELGFTVRSCSRIQSTMDIKSAMAKVSWRLNFKNSEGETVTEIVFDDDWGTIQRYIDAQMLKGYVIQSMGRTVSQYIQGE